jgi:putative ABC transport system ATP-binding protein
VTEADTNIDDAHREEPQKAKAPDARGVDRDDGFLSKPPDKSTYGITEALGASQVVSKAPQRTAAIEIRGLDHRLSGYGGSDIQFRLQIDELCVPRGCFCSITGSNGCGKTTLLTIMGLLQKPTEVQDFIMRVGPEKELTEFRIEQLWKNRKGRRKLQRLRRRELGFVLQSGGLLESLKACENIEFVLRANGWDPAESRQKIDTLCKRLEFNDKWKQRVPVHLSGGQQQITALARSIVHSPSLVLVDEPTASLNIKWARNTLTLLKQMQQKRGSDLTVVMVSHDTRLADEFGTYHVKMDVDFKEMRGYVDSTKE